MRIKQTSLVWVARHIRVRRRFSSYCPDLLISDLYRTCRAIYKANAAPTSISESPIAKLAVKFCADFSPNYTISFKDGDSEILIHGNHIYLGNKLVDTGMVRDKALNLLYKIKTEIRRRTDKKNQDDMGLRALSVCSSNEFFRATNPSHWEKYSRLQSIETCQNKSSNITKDAHVQKSGDHD